MTQRWVLDEIVDPFGAKVIVQRDPSGRVREARFDLSGLPRVETLLTGQPVADVPGLVERLCGICPAAHHLAGVRALEALAHVVVPPAAEAVRRLLHHGSAVETHATRLLGSDREAALTLRRFGKAAAAAAGSPGHFPVTAIPGGVRAPVEPSARDALAGQVASALAVAVAAAEGQLATPASPDGFAGADVALADEHGRPDLLGTRLRVVRGGAAGAEALEPAAPANRWDDLVTEEFPGRPAGRPYLVALGADRGRYRVGPVAQLRVGALTTPLARDLQGRWTEHGGAAAARAVITVHAVEAIAGLLDHPGLVAAAPPVEATLGDGIGVGWVDGPRGLLVHRYQAAGGRLVAASILTPTVQNEPWLAELLTRAAQDADAASVRLEDAVREADPCLPCSSAPVGAMGLVLETVSAAPAAGGD